MNAYDRHARFLADHSVDTIVRSVVAVVEPETQWASCRGGCRTRLIPAYTPNSGYTVSMLDNLYLNRVYTASGDSYVPVKAEENMMLQSSRHVLDDGVNAAVVDAMVTVEADGNSGHVHNRGHLQQAPAEGWKGHLNWYRRWKSRSCLVVEVGSK